MVRNTDLTRFLTPLGALACLLLWLTITPANLAAGEDARYSSDLIDPATLIDWGLDGSRVIVEATFEKDRSHPPRPTALPSRQAIGRASKSFIGSLAKLVGALLKGVWVVVFATAKYSLGLCAFIFGKRAFGR